MSRDPARQLPLALRFPPDQRLDTYVAAPAGAIAQLRALATEPGADWCYLAGAPGTGKTHLALGACAAAEARGRRAAYLPLRTAAGRVHDALEALDGADVVALDWLLRRVGRDLGGLARLFDRLDRASLAAQRRLTVPFLREALGDGG